MCFPVLLFPLVLYPFRLRVRPFKGLEMRDDPDV